MRRTSLLIIALILTINCLPQSLLSQTKANTQNSLANSTPKIQHHAQLQQIAVAKADIPIEPTLHPMSQPISIGSKTREALIKERHTPYIDLQAQASLPPISKGAPGNEVIITSDFNSQGNTGGAVLAFRDTNGDGIADQQTTFSNNAVDTNDAITKIVPSQLVAGRYFAITENSELIQLDDTDKDYVADSVIAYGDFKSSTGLGIGITTGILDDGTEAVYLMKIEPGPDGFFYTADDNVQISVFLDRNRDNNHQIDSMARFFTSSPGFTSLGGFAIGVETSLIFNLGRYDNAGRVSGGALYSYYDYDGDGIPDDFANNGNQGIFAEGTDRDVRPALATDMAAVGTDYYVTAPLTAFGQATGDDIAIYSDFNASQIADTNSFIFGNLPGLANFSSELGGLAVSLDGTRVAAVRNQVFQGDPQGSQLLTFIDRDFNQQADQAGRELFNNRRDGIGGVAFGNTDLLGPQPVIVLPVLRNSRKFTLDALGARIDNGAQLIIDGREAFPLRFNGTGTKAIVTANTLSSPNRFTINQVLTSGTHILTIKNSTGQKSLPVAISIR